jgi:hypothetical protein
MKKICMLICTCVIGLALVMGAQAQTGPAGQSGSETVKDRSAPNPAKPAQEGRRFVGTIASVNLPTRVLVVKNWRGETMFDASNARFARGAGLEELKPGERVLVRYVEEEGRKVAKAVITAQSKVGADANAGAIKETGKAVESPEKK